MLCPGRVRTRWPRLLSPGEGICSRQLGLDAGTAVDAVDTTGHSSRTGQTHWGGGRWRLTIAGAGRDASTASSPSARKKVCALVSPDAPACGRSASPLGVMRTPLLLAHRSTL